jgi:hypothetical protein
MTRRELAKRALDSGSASGSPNGDNEIADDIWAQKDELH